MDTFIEQIVKKRVRTVDIVLKYGVVFFGVLLILLLCLYATVYNILLFAAAGVGYVIFFTVRNMGIEFEYAYTNGSLDIDKIIGKRKRKNVVSIDCKSILEYGTYSPALFENRGIQAVINACGYADADDYYAIFNNNGKKTLLVFTPEERVQKNVLKTINRAAVKNV